MQIIIEHVVSTVVITMVDIFEAPVQDTVLDPALIV
jgi:hypothetical protein